MAMSLTSQIVEYGEVRRGRLGVIVQDLTPELASALGINATSGALISQVLPDSAAEEAGLQESDVVIGVNGKVINGAGSLRNVIGLARAGEEVEIEYVRDGDRFVETVKIRAEKEEISFSDPANAYLEGATLGEAPEGETGAVVLKVESGSRAWQAGLREEDVILSINRTRIKSLEDAKKVIAQNSSGNMLVLNIRRGNSVGFIRVR